MSNVFWHPRCHPRVDAAIDTVISGIRLSNLEEPLAGLGDTAWNELIVEAVSVELRQPASGLRIMLQRLRKVA